MYYILKLFYNLSSVSLYLILYLGLLHYTNYHLEVCLLNQHLASYIALLVFP